MACTQLYSDLIWSSSWIETARFLVHLNSDTWYCGGNSLQEYRLNLVTLLLVGIFISPGRRYCRLERIPSAILFSTTAKPFDQSYNSDHYSYAYPFNNGAVELGIGVPGIGQPTDNNDYRWDSEEHPEDRDNRPPCAS